MISFYSVTPLPAIFKNMTFIQEQAIFPIAAALSAAFTASSTTQLLTSAAHGLTVNESVLLTTSGGLPEC